MPLGTGVMLFSLLSEFSLFFFILGGSLILLPFIIMKHVFKKSAVLKKKTYAWYKEKYPDNVQGDIITCFKCETNSLDVRPLKNEFYQSEIFCTECGKSLYYLSL